jgi:Domain of unknown function (DUF4913)
VSDTENIDVLRAQMQRLTALVADLHDRVIELQTMPASTSVGSVSGPVFVNVNDWVTDRLIPMLERTTGTQLRWCTTWWAHPEVVSRFEACWRAWETLRLEPTLGMSVWYRDHLDPMLAVVMSGSGPFAACTPDRHAPVVPLPVVGHSVGDRRVGTMSD